jgi:hypothetical protein
MEHMKIHSYGGCQKNANANEKKGCENLVHYDQKLCVISKVEISSSFLSESSSTNFIYHSKIVSMNLMSRKNYGTHLRPGRYLVFWIFLDIFFKLLVYLGAPNVDIFTPTYGTGKKSIIKISDFESPESLATFLKELGNSREKYNDYLLWKAKEPTKLFSDLAGLSLDHSFTACRICKAVAKLRKELDRGTF